VLHVATMLWAPNQHSHPFSVYDETWVEKLYRGVKRNLTVPFRFVCFVDELRDFAETEIYQELMVTPDPDYGAQAEVYRLDEPTIFLQLDTIVVGNCDLFAEYCLTQKDIALSRDPYVPTRTVNGVAFAGSNTGGVSPAPSAASAAGTKKKADAAAGMAAKK